MTPHVVDLLDSHDWSIYTKANTAEVLQQHGIDVAGGAISAVVWSHPHFDHIGDVTTFPTSTKLVVGQDFQKTFFPTHPTNPNGLLSEADFKGRELQELDFASQNLKIGRFNAYDYFGDGSFYLLDTPGHTVAHICGLARTSPDSFILLGGDASHHYGEIRPSEYLPLPDEIHPSPIPHIASPGCPGHLFEAIHPDKSRTKPFYSLTAPFNHDLDLANWTLAGLQEFDCADNVWILIAHDATVADTVVFFPKTLKDWTSAGWNHQIRWKFLKSYSAAVAQ